jgi:hypothetical protein
MSCNSNKKAGLYRETLKAGNEVIITSEKLLAFKDVVDPFSFCSAQLVRYLRGEDQQAAMKQKMIIETDSIPFYENLLTEKISNFQRSLYKYKRDYGINDEGDKILFSFSIKYYEGGTYTPVQNIVLD